MIAGLRVNAQARSELTAFDLARLELNRYGFYFRVVGESIFAQFAPNPGLFKSAKRRGSIENVVAVYPHRSGAYVVGYRVSFGDVVGPNRGGQAVERFVGALNDFTDILEAKDGHDRAENFFLRDLHVVVHIGEHRGLNEKSLVADTIAARHQFGFLLLAGIDIAHHLGELFLVHLRTLLRILVEWIADRPLLGTRRATLHELVVDLVFHESTRTRAATLPLIKKQREVRAFDGFIHVCVREHDVGTLAAQLQRDALQIRFRRRFHNQ